MPDTFDLYKILQVDPSAEADVIKAAYRVLALKYHPDHNPAEAAADKMKQINHAYETLRDPNKRAEYNTNRNMWTSPVYSYAANHQPTYRDDYEPAKSRWYSTDSYVSSDFSFRARTFRQSEYGKIGVWVGILFGIIFLLTAIPNITSYNMVGTDAHIVLKLTTIIWISAMIFLIAWGLIWSVGDLLEHVYSRPKFEETPDNTDTA